jgi:hypothetical protein
MGRWTWACASHIGTSHLRTGQRIQDAFSCFTVSGAGKDFFVGIVSDGAGSAEYGGEGAALVCRCIGVAARRHFTMGQAIPSQTTLEYWVDEARDRIYKAAQARGKDARDFAATLVCAISDGDSSVFAHIGDGCAVVRERAAGQWVAPTWPDHGEYASMTTFVTDQPAAKLRISTLERGVDVISLFTDGIERMVLDMAAKRPSDRFFDVVSRPILASTVAQGRDGHLSRQLQAYLGSEQVSSRTDDDKTLVIAALR